MHTQCQGVDWPTRSPGIARRRRGPGSGTARPSRPTPIEAALHSLLTRKPSGLGGAALRRACDCVDTIRRPADSREASPQRPFPRSLPSWSLRNRSRAAGSLRLHQGTRSTRAALASESLAPAPEARPGRKAAPVRIGPGCGRDRWATGNTHRARLRATRLLHERDYAYTLWRIRSASVFSGLRQRESSCVGPSSTTSICASPS